MLRVKSDSPHAAKCEAMAPDELSFPEERVGFLRRVGYLFGPIALTVGLWYLIRWLGSEEFAQDLLVAGGASLFGFGTTVIFGPAIVPEISARLTTWELAVLVMYINSVSGFWYAYNLDLLQRLPKIGPFLKRARLNAVKTLKERPWIRRLSTVGVGAFVISPLPGSGSLGGCIVGRIIGVSRWASFVSVSIAGMIVAVAYAMLTDKLKHFLDKENVPWWVRVIGLIFVLLMVWLMIKLIRRLARVGTEEDAPATPAADDDKPAAPVASATVPLESGTESPAE